MNTTDVTLMSSSIFKFKYTIVDLFLNNIQTKSTQLKYSERILTP